MLLPLAKSSSLCLQCPVDETQLRTLRTGMVMLWPLTQTLRFLRFHRIACGQQAGPCMDKAPGTAHHVVEECVAQQNCQTLEAIRGFLKISKQEWLLSKNQLTYWFQLQILLAIKFSLVHTHLLKMSVAVSCYLSAKFSQ